MNTIKIYNVVSGPYHWSEVEDGNNDMELEWMLVCGVWDDEDQCLYHEEIECATLDDAREIMDFFKYNAGPYLMEVEDE